MLSHGGMRPPCMYGPHVDQMHVMRSHAELISPHWVHACMGVASPNGSTLAYNYIYIYIYIFVYIYIYVCIHMFILICMHGHMVPPWISKQNHIYGIRAPPSCHCVSTFET